MKRSAGVVSNISQCQISRICAIARVRDLAKSRVQVFIYLIFISSLWLVVGLGLIITHVAQISYCELFGNATHLAWRRLKPSGIAHAAGQAWRGLAYPGSGFFVL